MEYVLSSIDVYDVDFRTSTYGEITGNSSLVKPFYSLHMYILQFQQDNYSRSVIPFYSEFLPYNHPQAGFDPPIIMPQGHYLNLWLTNDLSNHGWIDQT